MGTSFRKRCELEALITEREQTMLRVNNDLLTLIAAETKLTDIATRIRALVGPETAPATSPSTKRSLSFAPPYGEQWVPEWCKEAIRHAHSKGVFADSDMTQDQLRACGIEV